MFRSRRGLEHCSQHPTGQLAPVGELALRHLVEETDGVFAVVAAEIELLRYYANSIAHLAAPAAADHRVVASA